MRRKTPAFTGGTWKLNTQNEWKQMFSANGGSEGNYTGLNTAITAAGGTALLVGGYYWTTSRNADGKNWIGELYSSGIADWHGYNVGNNARARACIAF